METLYRRESCITLGGVEQNKMKMVASKRKAKKKKKQPKTENTKGRRKNFYFHRIDPLARKSIFKLSENKIRKKVLAVFFLRCILSSSSHTFYFNKHVYVTFEMIGWIGCLNNTYRKRRSPTKYLCITVRVTVC